MTTGDFMRNSRYGPFARLVATGIVIVLMSMTSCKGQGNAQPQSKTGLNDELGGIKVVSLKEPFRIPCIDKFGPIEDAIPVNVASSKPVFHKYQKLTDCKLENSLTSKSLPAVPSGIWLVKGISLYLTKTGIFAAVFLVTYDGTGADMDVTFLDADGDGELDIAFQSSGLKQPILPDWLRMNQ